MRVIFNFDCQSIEQLEQMSLEHRPEIGLDTESVNLDRNSIVLGVAIALDEARGMYFFDPRDSMAKRFVSNADNVWLQNASHDIPKLQSFGYSINHFDDTMMLAYSAGILEKNLQSLSAEFLNKASPTVTELWDERDKYRKHKKDNEANIGIDHVKLGGISIIHACNTLALSHKIPRTELYDSIDRPSIDLVIEMEQWGVLIDQVQLTRVDHMAATETAQLEREILDELGLGINLGSSQQVAAALKLKGIIGTRKTQAGADSVSEEALKSLNNPLANKILKYRSKMKTISTYVPAFRNPDNQGRLHTTYGLTRTGRWNSSEPNLQNITTDTKFITEEE